MLDAVIPSEITDNILGVLWSKLTYTCYGYYGSLANTSMVESCAGPDDRRLLVDFFGEVVAVGTAAGARFIPLRGIRPAGPASRPAGGSAPGRGQPLRGVLEVG